MIFVGMDGLIFRVTLEYPDGSPVDLSTALDKYFTFAFPRQPQRERRDAELTGPGTDGEMEYASSAADLQRAGPYSVQGWCRTQAGQLLASEIHEFMVHDQ
jgi:hypothetical protein